jgi:N-acetylmuramoyl-L-alanine amidase
MKISILNSPNHSAKSRIKNNIKFIVIHYTGMQSERVCIRRLTSKSSEVSTHYLINRKGSITRLVDEKKTAWHAGKSKWKNSINLNNQSIGIELVNKGHQFGYEKFSKKQITNLILLCKRLVKKYKIKKQNIVGHSDIAPLRKKDPGEKFPWFLLAKKKIGYWHNVRKKNIKNQNLNKRNLRKFFFNNLYKIGYRYFVKNKPSKNDSKVIKAFQRRFRPKNVNGLIDQKCLQISYYLASTLKF